VVPQDNFRREDLPKERETTAGPPSGSSGLGGLAPRDCI